MDQITPNSTSYTWELGQNNQRLEKKFSVVLFLQSNELHKKKIMVATPLSIFLPPSHRLPLSQSLSSSTVKWPKL
ncbi:hypothetical protein L2E82_36340 [Cichorium intybus]|uniref:Uncharacterized protein n=1 Tax=Cichorium intybus TaxID=13427 RepID=A0ACB9BRE2_CICIN|nr:hypothetical protein L2E82_36340 [Cichorium intybus]